METVLPGAPITLPADFGFCVAAFVATIFLNFFQMVMVVKARKAYGVEYPHLYAPHDHKHKHEFDCVQRQHQQFLENAFFVTTCMFVNGLLFPKLAASLHMVWLLGGVIYSLGYTSSKCIRMGRVSLCYSVL